MFLAIWAAIHAYVFWRLSSIPWIQQHLSPYTLGFSALFLWASYPLSRMFVKFQPEAWPFEFAAATWVGTMFLLFSALVASEILTLGGFLLPTLAPNLRGGACLIALLLSLFGLFQGLRPPVVRDYEIELAGLPAERDGLVLVEVSDLHLGNLIGKQWMERLVTRVNDLKPDLIAAVGDVVDGEAEHLRTLIPVLQKMKAPLGVWAVTGNHEFYAGKNGCIQLMQDAGFTVLQDQWAEVTPGLVIAGVDDIGTRRSLGAAPIEKALANRPPGATLFLSHTPSFAETAAAAGANLMLCGHTHEGQIWPFAYLVGLRFKLLAGRYEVGSMPVVVCRGTGTWGPRMRLWRPSEILRIKLRAPNASGNVRPVQKS